MPESTDREPKPVNPISIEDFRKRVFELHPHWGPDAAETMRYTLRVLEKVPGITSTADFNRQCVERFLAEGGWSKPATVKTMLSRLRVLFRAAAREGWIDSDPFAEPPFLSRRKSPEEATLSHKDVKRLLGYLHRTAVDWAGRRRYTLVCLVIHTGLNLAEAVSLKQEDCDLKNRVIRIRFHSQRRRLRYNRDSIAIEPALSEVLAAWLPLAGKEWVFPAENLVEPWKYQKNNTIPTYVLETSGKALGIQGLCFRSLRRYWEANHRRNVPGLGGFKAPFPPVMLGGPDDAPRVRGKVKRKLSRSGYRVLHSLLAAGKSGMSKAELRTIAGDAIGILERLRDGDEDWRSVIHQVEDGKNWRIIREKP